jgi:hypothetical protein
MFKLTVSFETIEDLNHYVQELRGKQTQTQSQVEFPKDIPPVIEEKKPAKKSAPKKSAPVEVKQEVEAEFEEVESPFVEPQKPPFDRDGAIANAQKLVAQLKGTGIADDKLMPAIHEVYAQAGCPINLKISQLSDEQLSVFIPLFELQVKSIVSKTKAAQTTASFI